MWRSIARARRRRAPTPSAPPAAASARPTRTRSRAAPCGSSDLFHRERFAAKLGEILDYHNFILQRYFQSPAIDFQQVLESNLELGERLKPLVADVTGILEQLSVDGRNVLFEGAQGAMLDVDLGTYPYVTSSNTTAGGAATGTGLGPRRLHEVLGIVKAYATRVGAGPFPTELFDELRRASVARGP